MAHGQVYGLEVFPTCLPACLPAYLLPCLPACLPAYACLPAGLPASLPPCLPACLPPCHPTCHPAYHPACLPFACLQLAALAACRARLLASSRLARPVAVEFVLRSPCPSSCSFV